MRTRSLSGARLWLVLAMGLTCAFGFAPPRALALSPSDASMYDTGAMGDADTLGDVPPRLALVGGALAGPVDPAHYRVGPGDVFQLQLWGKVTRVTQLEIGPEGTIAIPGSGTVNLNGLTLDAARQRIVARVRESIRDIGLDVRLIRPRRFRVFLAGEVARPRVVEATGSARASDVLAGEVLRPDASRRNVSVLHRDGSVERADFGLLLQAGDPAVDPELRDGDIVRVPVAREFFFAAGAVASPGRFERAPGDSVATLLRLAGGPLPAADLHRLLWLRWSGGARPESTWVSLEDPASGLNLPLADADHLYVYYSSEYRLQHEATVLGEVTRAGAYPIIEGQTHLSEVIAAAGGFLKTADLSAVRVHRANVAGRDQDPELDRLLRMGRSEMTASEYEALRTRLAEHREDYRVDWAALERSPKSLDVLLRDGDVVRVDRLVSAVRVDGEVRSPAMLAYRPGLVVNDYIAQAGGFSARAWRGKIRVTRAVTGQTLFAHSVTQLDPGDFIWVPEKPDVTAWQQTRDVLTALAQIATVVIAIRSIR